VVNDLWRDSRPVNGAPYTTITTWHNTGKDLTYQGDRFYWTKDREFERFLDLPRRRSVGFELAAGVDEEVLQNLHANGWLQRDSVDLSASAVRYREYIQRSRGEFTVARDQYVRPCTGWFSDRSACYLAAGRPVIAQDTGLGGHVPTGEGLLTFDGVDDAADAISEVAADYEHHRAAARDFAERHLDAGRVLTRLIDLVTGDEAR
jgi:hypothetical protein